MSKYSPLSRGKEYLISNNKDASRKLEVPLQISQKSHTTTEGIHSQ